MKHYILLIITLLFLVVFPRLSYSQCQPDTVNCKDVQLPGEICPLVLPDGIVNEFYDQVFTVIPPYQAQTEYGPINIVKIVIDTVGNLPPGLTYQTNSDTFYVNNTYCVLLSGIPTTPGNYDLYIRVIPFVYSIITGVIPFPAVTDDTSLTITIKEPSGIDEFSGKTFSTLEAFPNPFKTSIKIGFYTRDPSQFELQIYNLIGQLVYSENITGIPGRRNYFNFNGIDLKPGTYLYAISGNGNSVTKKLIKLQ